MEHNPDLTDDQDASLYLQRNLIKQKDSVIKIVRDEEVGRFVFFIFRLLFWYIPKLFWPDVRKYCSSDREKTFESQG